MAFREVRVFEVREVLRLWLGGEGIRAIERLVGLDRKTVRRYVAAGEAAGLVRDGGEGQLSDGFVGSVVEAVRPHRVDGRGESWRLLAVNHDQIAAWVEADLTAVKIHDCWAAAARSLLLATSTRLFQVEVANPRPQLDVVLQPLGGRVTPPPRSSSSRVAPRRAARRCTGR